MSKKDKWEPCPRCGSNRVESRWLLLCCVRFLSYRDQYLVAYHPACRVIGIIIGILLMLISPLMRNMPNARIVKTPGSTHQKLLAY